MIAAFVGIVVGGLVVITTARPILEYPVLGSNNGAAVSATGSDAASASPSAAPTEVTSEGLAGSRALLEDFDALPVGTRVEGWDVIGSAALDVVALPTAIDRSMRLTAESVGSACRVLGLPLASLTAEIMMDDLPAREQRVASIELADGSVVGLSVSADGARLSDAATAAPMDRRSWYRWSVTADGGGGFAVRLVTEDGALIDEASISSSTQDAGRFCVTTVSPGRIYLDTIEAEAN